MVSNMARPAGIVFSLALLMFLAGCGSQGNERQQGGKHTVTVAGSTSVMPFTEKLAEHFMIDHPQFTVDVQGGGSTAGIQACMNGTVNIGMSSRLLKDDEKSLTEIVICFDGISIIVHPDNPLKNLTLTSARDIFAGRIRNWKELGWIDRNIDGVTREEGSGTRGSFEDMVMNGNEIGSGIMVQDSNGSVREVVATDPYAIGYISLGLVDKRVRTVAVDGIVPTVAAIKQKRYRIVRPFLYLVNGQMGKDTRTFIDWVLGKDGQKILKNEGLIGVND